MTEDGRSALPARLHPDRRHVTVLDVAIDERLPEAFYDEAISRLAATNASRRALDLDEPSARTTRPVEPAAMILHVGRCGSTLLGRMLAQDAEHLVVSEPSCLASLQWAAGRGGAVARDVGGARTRGLLDAFGRAADGRRQRLIVKLSSWQAIDVAWLRQLLPGVPLVFLWRDVEAVVASSLRTPPGWAHHLGDPAPDRSRFFPWLAAPAHRDRDELTVAELYAAAWASIVSAVLEADDPETMLVRYEDLVTDARPTLDLVLDHIGSGGAATDEMVDELGFYAKASHRSRAFDVRAAAEGARLPAALAARVDAMVGDLREQLISRHEADR